MRKSTSACCTMLSCVQYVVTVVIATSVNVPCKGTVTLGQKYLHNVTYWDCGENMYCLENLSIAEVTAQNWSNEYIYIWYGSCKCIFVIFLDEQFRVQ